AEDGEDAGARPGAPRQPLRHPGSLGRRRSPPRPLPARGPRTAEVSSPEAYEIRIPDGTVADLRQRHGRAPWPAQPAGAGWHLGSHLSYVEEACAHWGTDYDCSRLERLNDLGSERWDGIHFLRLDGTGGAAGPVVLLHGWPSGPIEYEPAARLVAETGRQV